MRKSQCIRTLVWAIIGLALLFVPYAIYDDGLVFAHQVMPFFSSNAVMLTLEDMAIQVVSAFSLIGIEISVEIFEFISKISFYGLYAFYGIFVLDIVLSVLLLILGSEVLRKIAKIISVFAGIAFILIAITSLINLIGVVNIYVTLRLDILSVIKASGAIFYLVAFIFSIAFAKKQFTWFSFED